MAKKIEDAQLTMERRGNDRRKSDDRRKASVAVDVERRTGPRREKVSRRRQIDPTTCERDYTDAEVEFMSAMDQYKRKNGRMFPTCSEILEVIRDLGYIKAAVAPVVLHPEAAPADFAAETSAE